MLTDKLEAIQREQKLDLQVGDGKVKSRDGVRSVIGIIWKLTEKRQSLGNMREDMSYHYSFDRFDNLDPTLDIPDFGGS